MSGLGCLSAIRQSFVGFGVLGEFSLLGWDFWILVALYLILILVVRAGCLFW